jgi:hypothetical protein
MYNYVLALVLLDEKDKAINAYEKAKAEFPLVAKELKKKRHTKPKPALEGYIAHGSTEEAFEYWKEFGSYWANSEKAMLLINR